MVLPVAELTLYVDCVSPYSYFAYLNLCRYREILHRHRIKTQVVPFFLGGARDGNGSPYQEPPPVKAAWSAKDLAYTGRILGVKVKRPDVFPISSLYPVRVVTYIHTNFGAELTERSLVRLWEAYWTQGRDISSRQVIKDSLRPIFPDTSQLEAVLEGATTSSNKARTRETTDFLMKGGCFGAPWFVVTNSTGQTEQFWGNDRWDHVFQHLDVPFTPVTLLPPETSSQLHGKL
ncbi:hypothetical protein ASPBRDRAFT_42288 [Aspergillus brasiliensis CBS 101740]|uniref:Glutathione S-transferase kappa n=1 Tax=Aspergillus brasiliensis (strain CBS 101740 / IMI 381727 / IBT 21946) TaxID=767769 RepID=A0A1L9ULW9_ASPBC|nr:hypothetical protein ASPBRDRAFT_42288 [Aspergillus brasiliensis CBS 101740]